MNRSNTNYFGTGNYGGNGINDTNNAGTGDAMSSDSPDISEEEAFSLPTNCNICELHVRLIADMNTTITEMEETIIELEEEQQTLQQSARPKCNLCHAFVLRIMKMDNTIKTLKGQLEESKSVAEEAMMMLQELLVGQDQRLSGYRRDVEKQQKEHVERIWNFEGVKGRIGARTRGGGGGEQ